jgi:acyl carrier protein
MPAKPQSLECIREAVVRTVGDVLALREPAPLEARIEEDLGASSIDRLTLMVALEDEFAGMIPADVDLGDIDPSQLTTVSDVVDIIAAYLAAPG